MSKISELKSRDPAALKIIKWVLLVLDSWRFHGHTRCMKRGCRFFSDCPWFHILSVSVHQSPASCRSLPEGLKNANRVLANALTVTKAHSLSFVKVLNICVRQAEGAFVSSKAARSTPTRIRALWWRASTVAGFFFISPLNIYRLRQACAPQRWSDGDVDLTDWLFVCQQKAIWRGEECGRVQSDLLLVWSGGESGVLEKINNVAPPGELSLWYHIPSESRSFPLFIGPIRLTCAPLPPPCNIEEGAEEQKGEISTATAEREYGDILFPSCRHRFFLRCKNLIFAKPWRMK